VFEVLLRRRWFGEELQEKLAQLEHPPSEAELLDIARHFGLGGGAILYVTGREQGPAKAYRVRELREEARN